MCHQSCSFVSKFRISIKSCTQSRSPSLRKFNRVYEIECNFLFKAGPLDLSFRSYFIFLHCGREEVERYLLCKADKKIQRKSWSSMPPKLVACSSESRFLNEVVHKIGRLRKFNRAREIEFNIFTARTIFMKLGTLVHHGQGYKTLPQSFNFCSET